jgi:hypothetical protein
MQLCSVTKLNWAALLQNIDTVTCASMSGWQRSFGLHIGFIHHFTTLLVITLNQSAISYFHNLLVLPARRVFTSSCLATAPRLAISLLPCSSPLKTAANLQLPSSQADANPLVFSSHPDFCLSTNQALTLPFAYNISARTT